MTPRSILPGRDPAYHYDDVMRIGLLVLAMGLLAGCGHGPAAPGRAEDDSAAQRRSAPGASRLSRPIAHAKAEDEGAGPSERGQAPFSAVGPIGNVTQTGPKKEPVPRGAGESVPGGEAPRRTLGELLDRPADSVDRWLPGTDKVKVDDAAVAAAGVRRLEGRHVVLYTDLPAGEAVDFLPAAFDQAVPQWREYFNLEQAKVADWRPTAFLIRDRELFRRLGLLPDDLPPFQHGFSRNTDIWVYEKPSDYFNRHELLHEGTHCFMNTLLGGCGSPWFMEGIAELLSTHRLVDGRVELNQVPRTRQDVPLLGRIKLVRDDMAAGRAKTLRQVLAFRPDEYLENGPYAWSWAAALFLDHHPVYGPIFRQRQKDVLRRDLTQRFVAAVGDGWPALETQWRAFLDELDYGCDPGKMFVDLAPGKPLDSAGARVEVSADRGWQASGLHLEQGKTYRLEAEGRYQVARDPKIWWCEPGGVTIRYYRGRPLGMLLAAVLPEGPPADSPGPFRPPLAPIAVGLGTTLIPERSGTLYLRINESSGELADNAGKLSVEIRPE